MWPSVQHIMDVTVREIFDAGLWDDYCNASGTSDWGPDEGPIQDDTVLELAESTVPKMLGLPPMQLVE